MGLIPIFLGILLLGNSLIQQDSAQATAGIGLITAGIILWKSPAIEAYFASIIRDL